MYFAALEEYLEMPNLLKISNLLKIPACKMVSNKNLHKVAKFLEWMILLGLLAGAIVFQEKAWEMYLSGDSSFSDYCNFGTNDL